MTRTPPPNTKWTPEQDDEIARLCKAGLSASQIAARFGDCSRNAVIGRIYRLQKAGKIAAGLQRPSPAARSANAAKARAAQARKAPAAPKMKLIAGVPVRAVKPKAEPKPVQVEAPKPQDQALVAPLPDETTSDMPIEKIGNRAWAFEPLPGRAPVPSVPAGGGVCCWPTNGLFGREPVCCGAPAPLMRPYCAAHARIAYNPAPPKELRYGA